MASNECILVNDLLPLYIEQSVSAESGDIIQKHLQHCSTCQETYASMTASMPDIKPAPHPEIALQNFQKRSRKKIWHAVFAVFCITCILWSLFSLWLLQPAFHGFKSLGSHNMAVSVSGDTTTITIDAADKQRPLRYMYSLNTDGSLTLYFSYGSLLTQYTGQRWMTAYGLKDHSLTWNIAPASLLVSQNSITRSSFGGRTPEGEAAGTFSLNEAQTVILTAPIQHIYYVPDLPNRLFEEYCQAMETSADTLTDALSENGLTDGTYPIPTDAFDFSQLSGLVTLY